MTCSSRPCGDLCRHTDAICQGTHAHLRLSPKIFSRAGASPRPASASSLLSHVRRNILIQKRHAENVRKIEKMKRDRKKSIARLAMRVSRARASLRTNPCKGRACKFLPFKRSASAHRTMPVCTEKRQEAGHCSAHRCVHRPPASNVPGHHQRTFS